MKGMEGRKKNTRKQQYKQTVHTEQTVQIHIEHSTQCFFVVPVIGFASS